MIILDLRNKWSKGVLSLRLANLLLEELANSMLEELANSLNGLFGLLMAFKVNFDPTIGFLVSNMIYIPSFRPVGTDILVL